MPFNNWVRCSTLFPMLMRLVTYLKFLDCTWYQSAIHRFVPGDSSSIWLLGAFSALKSAFNLSPWGYLRLLFAWDHYRSRKGDGRFKWDRIKRRSQKPQRLDRKQSFSCKYWNRGLLQQIRSLFAKLQRNLAVLNLTNWPLKLLNTLASGRLRRLQEWPSCKVKL
jgi:hypothetical protein